MVQEANITPEVQDAFAKVTNTTYRWAIAAIEGPPDVIVLKHFGLRDSTIEDLCAVLADEPCYVVYDFEGTRADSSTLTKTCFVAFAPDSCMSMKKKFALQNYKASVKSKINCQKEMQINDKADFNEREFA